MSIAVTTRALADDAGKLYEVIRNNRGERAGTIEGDGVTSRLVIYDTRGRRIGVIDPDPDYSQPTHPTVEDFIDEEHRAEQADR